MSFGEGRRSFAVCVNPVCDLTADSIMGPTSGVDTDTDGRLNPEPEPDPDAMDDDGLGGATDVTGGGADGADGCRNVG